MTTSTTIDEKINSLFKIVNQKKEEVKADEKKQKNSWQTNCSFKLYSTTPINIQTSNEISIVQALTELLTFSNNVDAANEILGLKTEFKHDGYTVEQWVDDFKKRIIIIHLAVKKDELKKLEERLSAIVSPEQRRQMELEAIMKGLED